MDDQQELYAAIPVPVAAHLLQFLAQNHKYADVQGFCKVLENAPAVNLEPNEKLSTANLGTTEPGTIVPIKDEETANVG
jgi:hypothetical protein